jgi:quercetin dioxygenase-like cupin family protein
MEHGGGILRENCHDQDNRQCPSKDTLTPDGVGPRRTRDTLFNGVVAHAHCARFKSNSVVVGAGNGASKRGSPGQCELVAALKPLWAATEVTMPDTTIKKVEADTSPKGEMGQRYLVAGKRVSMRLWIDEPGGKLKAPTSREYETVGYVISGSAKLELEGQTLNLKRGDSWLVPAGAMHQYTIIEPFTAVEATAPPAEVHGRDTPA